jgi:hypothetical protein
MTSSNAHTADQIRAKDIAAMGVDLGEVYSALWQQLSWLHRKWGHYVDLFGTGSKRVTLLNETAPNFFRTVQDSLLENVFLHIARLTDPPKSAGKDNLSFKRLPALLTDSALRSEVNTRLAALNATSEFARDWRNRRLAHGDLSLALDRAAEPLAPASRSHVKDALSAMGTVLNAVSLHYHESTTMFEFVGEPSAGGATSMLYLLRSGREAESRRRERIRSGTYTPEDMEHRGA